MGFPFENLDVYQRALNLAERLHALCDQSGTRGNAVLGDELRRASLSIAVRVAEGNGRWHAAERRQCFAAARDGALQCVPLVELGARRRLLAKESKDELPTELEAIAKMVGGLLRGMEEKQRGGENQG